MPAPSAAAVLLRTAASVALVSVLDELRSGTRRAEAGASQAPASLLRIDRAAARACDVHWLLLTATHAQESNFSRLRVGGINGTAVSSG